MRLAATTPKDPPWLVSGEEFLPVFHGGRRKVRKVDPEELQRRDPGFYGRGFYVTTSPDYARWYGNIISEYRFRPGTIILEATLRPQEAPPGMVETVLGHIDRKWREAVRARGKEAQFDETMSRARELPLDWRDVVEEYGVDLEVDAIAFSRGEIVVHNPDVLIFVR